MISYEILILVNTHPYIQQQVINDQGNLTYVLQTFDSLHDQYWNLINHKRQLYNIYSAKSGLGQTKHLDFFLSSNTLNAFLHKFLFFLKLYQNKIYFQQIRQNYKSNHINLSFYSIELIYINYLYIAHFLRQIDEYKSLTNKKSYG
ncbi:hypothetical protein pb186bvf_003073 [Paramecium bursaria]